LRVPPDEIFERGRALAAAFAAARCSAIVVSEETGWGIVPEYPSARAFRDALGRLNAEFARVADAAYLVVSGYALDLKRGTPVDPSPE
ncbi:MAG TPA: bifunctional adenosylcobinamide kinase/adenosylcobinamide-phosphate guanylyltransferase, partial [Candidatus Baltobacteraceae bacterium]|nr:bifunctional adenosylcobinamide kinase/adenosylcobinamide-phosphate guanylyltransferase [Candidatus Baltobacteraceae bacterium]